MREVFPIIISIFIVGLFLYSKLLPFKNKLLPNYRKVFNFFESIFEPIINFLRNVIKPVKVGLGLSVDMSQVILLVILLIILNFY
jgi:uncharacterized protein YggT (Ycf19 family)